MKQFVMGLALLMFVWVPATGAADDHVAVVLQQTAGVQTAAFEQFYGDTLPPMVTATFCQLHKLDCRPKAPFADRIQLTPARLSELKLVNESGQHDRGPDESILSTTARSIGGLTPSMAKGTAKITCWKSAASLSRGVGLKAHC